MAFIKVGNFLRKTAVTGAFVACAGAALAQQAQQQVQDIDSVISVLLNQGNLEQAQAVLEASNPSEIDRLFFLGRVLKATGRLAEAIEVFREVLRRDPTHINAMRELAHTLLMAGQFDVAEYHFNRLLEVDTNPQMRDGYRGFLNVIDQNKPVGISGSFAIVPSSNLNNGTTNTTLSTILGNLTVNQPPVSGVGANIGLSGFFRKSFNAQNRLVLDWSLSGTVYKTETYNNANALVSLNFEHYFERGMLRAGPYARQGWDSKSTSSIARGVNLTLQYRLSEQWSTNASLSYEQREYPNETYRNGDFRTGTLSVKYQVDPSLSFSLGITGENSNPPTSAHLQYDGRKVFGQVSKAWDGGLQTTLGLELGRRDFVGNFPLTTAPRADTYYGINISASNSRLAVGGFVPGISCSYTQTRSNVAFFDYDVSSCRFELSRNF